MENLIHTPLFWSKIHFFDPNSTFLIQNPLFWSKTPLFWSKTIYYYQSGTVNTITYQYIPITFTQDFINKFATSATIYSKFFCYTLINILHFSTHFFFLLNNMGKLTKINQKCSKWVKSYNFWVDDNNFLI